MGPETVFNPTTLLWLAGASNAIRTFGALRTGFQAAEQGRFERDLAEREADIARRNAEFEVTKRRRALRSLIGEQRAAAADSGFEGSPLLFIAEAVEDAELDVLALRQQGREAAQTAKLRGQAASQRGSEGRTAGIIRAGSSLITGVTELGERFGDTGGVPDPGIPRRKPIPPRIPGRKPSIRRSR